jgi:hypothetical protein
MGRFTMREAARRMYAFHMSLTTKQGAEYTQGIELYAQNNRDMLLAQAFYSPDLEERIRLCLVTTEAHNIGEVYTAEDLSNAPFRHGLKERSVLTAGEIQAFAEKGLKVIKLDRIN